MASQTNDNKVGDNTDVENLSLLQKGEKENMTQNSEDPLLTGHVRTLFAAFCL